MALIVADRVQETSTTTGTGAFTLLGATTGYRAASTVAANGDTFTYYAEDIDASGRPLGGWETGLGTWGTGNILTRTTIYASSNANAAVSWAAGTRKIGLGLVATAAVANLTVNGATTLSSSLNGVLKATSGLVGAAVADTDYPSIATVAGKCPMSGFPVDSAQAFYVSLGYVSATRTVTITPTGGTFDFFVHGVKYTKTGAQALAHPATQGGWFIYYDATGTLVASQTVWNLDYTAPVAYVFYDAATATGICMKEHHHAETDVWIHARLHAADGTQQISGFAASGYVLATPSDANIRFGIASGVMADEDLFTTTTALAPGGTVYTCMNRTGAAGDWTISTQTLPLIYSASTPMYNQYTGATWQMTVLDTVNNYGVYWVFGVPSITAATQIILVPHQAVFGTLAVAQAVSVNSLSWGTMPFQEIVPLYQIVYRFGTAFAGTARCRIESVTKIIGSKASITALAQANHGALAGLTDPNSHPATAISYVPTGNIVATDVQAALTEVDAEKIAITSIDATGGVPGLTLYKLNLKNAANTFTNYFTNASTASRTWTLPDKDGTVAMTVDIPSTLPNPSAVTFNNSGTGAASGSTYTGSAAVTISYNSIGAQPAGSYLTAEADTLATVTARGNATTGSIYTPASVGNGYKFWDSTGAYSILMGSAADYVYGPVTDYSMKLSMGNGAGRGITFGQFGVAPVAAINTTSGNMTIAGAFSAASKSFLIPHPTKVGLKLRYGSLEGPEHGVYVRGRLKGEVIELPDYWTALVEPDSITVQLTPIGKHQKLYVESIQNNTVIIGNENLFGSIDCFFTVNGTRQDIDKLVIEE